jgi:hypothetical protein
MYFLVAISGGKSTSNKIRNKNIDVNGYNPSRFIHLGLPQAWFFIHHGESVDTGRIA